MPAKKFPTLGKPCKLPRFYAEINCAQPVLWRRQYIIGSVTRDQVLEAATIELKDPETFVSEVKDGKVTTGWVVTSLEIAKDTAVRDLKGLCELNLLVMQGKGRGVHYVPNAGQ